MWVITQTDSLSEMYDEGLQENKRWVVTGDLGNPVSDFENYTDGDN